VSPDTNNLRPFGGTCAPSAGQRTYEGAAALRILEGDEGAQVPGVPGRWSARQARRKKEQKKHLTVILNRIYYIVTCRRSAGQ